MTALIYKDQMKRETLKSKFNVNFFSIFFYKWKIIFVSMFLLVKDCNAKGDLFPSFIWLHILRILQPLSSKYFFIENTCSTLETFRINLMPYSGFKTVVFTFKILQHAGSLTVEKMIVKTPKNIK